MTNQNGPTKYYLLTRKLDVDAHLIIILTLCVVNLIPANTPKFHAYAEIGLLLAIAIAILQSIYIYIWNKRATKFKKELINKDNEFYIKSVISKAITEDKTHTLKLKDVQIYNSFQIVHALHARNVFPE